MERKRTEPLGLGETKTENAEIKAISDRLRLVNPAYAYETEADLDALAIWNAKQRNAKDTKNG